MEGISPAKLRCATPFVITVAGTVLKHETSGLLAQCTYKLRRWWGKWNLAMILTFPDTSLFLGRPYKNPYHPNLNLWETFGITAQCCSIHRSSQTTGRDSTHKPSTFLATCEISPSLKTTSYGEEESSNPLPAIQDSSLTTSTMASSFAEPCLLEPSHRSSSPYQYVYSYHDETSVPKFCFRVEESGANLLLSIVDIQTTSNT